ncbi:MAG: 4Fe-4S dicluster domain-containing protein [Salinivirgaceae bacterium]|nr:4Fe-4S dicluster domain-containing protein [Salinivirgaceae bacterium]
MGKLYDQLAEDVRLEEGLNACMNCGMCTAICPAAEFYEYDPRRIADMVQKKDDAIIEDLLKSETIWYCGQCMSCKTRCPRGNAPGFIIQALRKLSIKMGYFTCSEKGRQQFALKRTIGENILKHGYCVSPKLVTPWMHPEQGPMWEWYYSNVEGVMARLGGNYQQDGAGTMRKIRQEDLDELKSIFDTTGGTEMYEAIERFSEQKAKEMGVDFENGDYFNLVYHTNSQNED